jgi:hypothetical protein
LSFLEVLLLEVLLDRIAAEMSVSALLGPWLERIVGQGSETRKSTRRPTKEPSSGVRLARRGQAIAKPFGMMDCLPTRRVK